MVHVPIDQRRSWYPWRVKEPSPDGWSSGEDGDSASSPRSLGVLGKRTGRPPRECYCDPPVAAVAPAGGANFESGTAAFCWI